jgi:serine O-acetyltransferase
MNIARHVMQDFRHAGAEATPPRIYTVRGIALALFRVSQLAGRRAPALGVLVKQINHVITGSDLAWQAEVGQGLNLLHPTGVVIGKHVKIGVNCKIQDSVTIGGKGGDNDGHPVIGDGVSVGCGAKILGPISIGTGATIGANAVVLMDVPEQATAVGVPARSIIAKS